MGFEQFDNINSGLENIGQSVSSRVNAAQNYLLQAGPEIVGTALGVGVIVWALRKCYKETLGNIL